MLLLSGSSSDLDSSLLRAAMEVLDESESSLEPPIKADPFLTQTCGLHLSLNDINPSVIALPQPSDFVELLSERLHVLDSDSLVDFKSSFLSVDVSSLDTKLFSDSGTESDDSGFHSFSDLTLFARGRSFSYDDDLIDNTMYCMDMNEDCCEEIKEDVSDEDSDSSSGGSSSDGSSSSSDEEDEDDFEEEDNGE